MDEATRQLAARVRSAPSPGVALDALRGAYDSKTLVVVTCGPSLGRYEPHALRERLSSVPVVAVKQAIDVLGDVADFLCFNSFNVQRFSAGGDHTIRVFQRAGEDRWPQLNDYDLMLTGEPHDGDLRSSLSMSHRFDEYLLSRTQERPWGPGIMYELVMYLAVHLGVSRLITIGWDIATESGSNRHFYDGREDAFFDRERSEAYALAGIRGRLPDRLKLALRHLRAARAHFQGSIYNKTLMMPGEAEVTARASGSVSDWLAGHGVELIVASPHSLVDQSVKRVTDDDLWSLVEAAKS